MLYKLELTFANGAKHTYSEDTMYREEDYLEEFNQLCLDKNYEELKVFLELYIDSLESDEGKMTEMNIIEVDEVIYKIYDEEDNLVMVTNDYMEGVFTLDKNEGYTMDEEKEGTDE